MHVMQTRPMIRMLSRSSQLSWYTRPDRSCSISSFDENPLNMGYMRLQSSCSLIKAITEMFFIAHFRQTRRSSRLTWTRQCQTLMMTSRHEDAWHDHQGWRRNDLSGLPLFRQGCHRSSPTRGHDRRRLPHHLTIPLQKARQEPPRG